MGGGERKGEEEDRGLGRRGERERKGGAEKRRGEAMKEGAERTKEARGGEQREKGCERKSGALRHLHISRRAKCGLCLPKV